MGEREELVIEHTAISSPLPPTSSYDQESHLPALLLPAIIAHVMIALPAINDVRATGLRDDVVRTTIAFVAVPSCWDGGQSLSSARARQRNITQTSVQSVPRSTDSLL